jgi:hypothetical protein
MINAMKTILIPTDFNTKSLEAIPALVDKYYPEQVDVLLVHMMSVTDCVRELLMLSRRSAEYRHIPQEFYATCTELKNTYSQLANIRIEFFYGNTVAVFKNYLENNEVDAILQDDAYEYKMLNKTSIHPSVLTSRCADLLIKVDKASPEAKKEEEVKVAEPAEVEGELAGQYA